MALTVCSMNVKLSYKKLKEEFTLIQGKVFKQGVQCFNRVWCVSAKCNVHVEWIYWCIVNQEEYIEIPKERELIETPEVLSKLYSFTSKGLLFTNMPRGNRHSGIPINTNSKIVINGKQLNPVRILFILYHNKTIPKGKRVRYHDVTTKSMSKSNIYLSK